MVQVKSNLAPTGSAILFEVAEQGVDFIDEVEMTADEAFSAIAPKMGRPSEKSDAATDFILSLLLQSFRLLPELLQLLHKHQV